ncbi:squalene--hopene cyclase [Maribellus sp. CM-23]|uniref:prenyltransferase/squalene oxidase repeat-containing protein n=1 Tax=Maribellus sp. CM-23 TaxID=2781026 RepID=UPI001F4196F3|nr:prenyltransferase/squalene oxidase repeat-containing protein [Maribellus sp. CM-23]MCE4565465.1 squalene--hopene cyclase [Maribellus sp. CM-23]
MDKKKIHHQLNEVGRMLASKLNPEGYWEGRLSSSALGVAVAVAALHFDDPQKNSDAIQRGIRWLQQNINSDGSYGDTPESPGNVSTSLLVYAALNLYSAKKKAVRETQQKTAGYLKALKIDVNSPQVAEFILEHYQKDYTFSVPILAMCGLCGVPGEDAFRHIPQLPFELSLLPRPFYRLLNLSVVSYAIPALVAVGIVIFKKKKSNRFGRFVRRFSIPRAMRILHRMLPESGGFLEAVPLTAFVALSLINSGFADTEVVRKGVQFLKRTQREDGGWPIDVDLSTWVTSLSVKAFRSNLSGFLTTDQEDDIADHFKLIQNDRVHPFNGTAPGGWGWTSFSGSVPDGDDTPGVILALLNLEPERQVKNEILNGARWLKKLQNSDGGFPTFSRGWGKLPFDQSCSDLTGHCLLAVSAVLETYRDEIRNKDVRALKTIFERALKYLEHKQSGDGSWVPLWFGNQSAGDHSNPVYGTAKVVTYLKDALTHNWHSEAVQNRLKRLIKSGQTFLMSVQNEDGSWGGGKSIPGTIEETSLAMSALVSKENTAVCMNGHRWLETYIQKNGFKPAPIGLYFASLWYDEALYPVTAYLEALSRTCEQFAAETVTT